LEAKTVLIVSASDPEKCYRFRMKFSASICTLFYTLAVAIPCFAAPKVVSVAEQVETVNAQLFNAINKRDRATLEKRIAGDAIFSGSGSIETNSKTDILEEIPEKGKTTFVLEDWTTKIQRTNVTIIGEGTMTPSNGMPIQFNFVNVFVKREGYWQVLLSYVAPSNPPIPHEKKD
jgi:hypothetical protein